MLGTLAMNIRSWNWRRKHRPEAVGYERPQVATQGTKLARFVAANHLLPVNDDVAKAFPPRKAS